MRPQLLEVSPEGAIAVRVPLQPETDNAHMQTRMARKLANGNYLVPHLLAFAVKEYTADGTVLNTIRTDLPELGGREAKVWPFTAIRLNPHHPTPTGDSWADGLKKQFPCSLQLQFERTTAGAARSSPEPCRTFKFQIDKKLRWDIDITAAD